jgi:hypothetical protein
VTGATATVLALVACETALPPPDDGEPHSDAGPVDDAGFAPDAGFPPEVPPECRGPLSARYSEPADAGDIECPPEGRDAFSLAWLSYDEQLGDLNIATCTNDADCVAVPSGFICGDNSDPDQSFVNGYTACEDYAAASQLWGETACSHPCMPRGYRVTADCQRTVARCIESKCALVTE